MPSTSFSDMPTLASSSPTPPPTFHRRRKSWARRVERCCCRTFSYFPLLFVYGLTTWAVYVEVDVSSLGGWSSLSLLRAALGITLYALANVSYTTAVFTGPGSPADERRDVRQKVGGGYEGLPTYEDEVAEEVVPSEWAIKSVTAKSTGKPRYCKKCKTVKPDRTHHCSTCQQCVLKMDHHCPWLATCVGLRNYKPFLLFLVYTSLFCWLCFAVTAWWVWFEIVDGTQTPEGLRVVNTILLAVLAGIIGLVLSGFTGWHIYLVLTGQTTIESLEKTRYLSPLRKSMEHQFQEQRTYLGQGESDTVSDDQPLAERLKEIHANALPGVLRPEEGDTSLTPSRTPTPNHRASSAQDSLQRSYASLEAQRERARYESYLDEQDSERLPNAFDMGWRSNLLHVFGDQPLYWGLPVCNTSGDGWQWDVSPKWIEARERIAKEREMRAREEAMWAESDRRDLQVQPARRDFRWTPGQGFVNHGGGPPPQMNGASSMQMQPLDRRKEDGSDGYDTSSDEDLRQGMKGATENWNDVPADFLAPRTGGRSRSRGRTKGD